MFIPTWLLILIVVVVISAFLPNVWGDILAPLAFVFFALLTLVSLPATVYFAYRHDAETALVVSLPWIAMGIGGIWLMSVEGIRSSFWLHEIPVRSAPTPQAIEKLRRELSAAIGLDSKMWLFREDVKHFPSYFSVKK
jgi:hypothetical protein